jgi:hypothetical protein
MQGKLKSLVSGFQTCVAALEERSHVPWYKSVGKTYMSIFALDVTQIHSAGQIQVDNATVSCQGSNACLPDRIFESDKSHRNPAEWPAANTKECIGRRQSCLESGPWTRRSPFVHGNCGNPFSEAILPTCSRYLQLLRCRYP